MRTITLGELFFSIGALYCAYWTFRGAYWLLRTECRKLHLRILFHRHIIRLREQAIIEIMEQQALTGRN